MHRRMRLLKYWKWIGGAAAAASVSVVVAHYSTTSASTSLSAHWTPSKPSNVPDFFGKWDYNWDKREPYSLLKPPSRRTKSQSDQASSSPDNNNIVDQLEKLKAKASRHIFLIRHGKYNMDGGCDEERYLTSTGESQAELTGKRLKNSEISFTSFISSDMTRAIQTANIILKTLEQKGLCVEDQDALLREGSPCAKEPFTGRWHPDLHYYEDGSRIEAAFRKYFHRADPEQENDSFEIIVCHANVIRYFVCRALQFPGEAWIRLDLRHCSLTVLSILPSGRVVLRAFGDSGHMPKSMSKNI
ncbi:unnamed protein product [Orchesella dallaii]|uniref:Serine/threonine-protein phosphatase PGAM5, mitochondrial n=1 Tax=Orchesella dallaii TaxID=48710 RepID=A0ABP1RIW1_9HEXA